MVLVMWGGLDMWRGLCEGQAVVACAKLLGSRACARLDRLVVKERRCERDAGTTGGEAGEKAGGRAGEGGGASRHGAGHATRQRGARTFIAPEQSRNATTLTKRVSSSRMSTTP